MHHSFATSRWPATLVIVGLALGCGKQPVPDPDSGGPVGPAIPATSSGLQVSEDECREFGRRLEQAVATENKAEAEQLLRHSDLLERAVSGIGLTEFEKQVLVLGAAKTGGEIVEELIQIVKTGGRYSVLRVRSVAGRPHVLMRLLTNQGVVNYHDFTLVRYSDGQVGTDDVYVYGSGETLTQTYRRLMVRLMAEHKGDAARLSGEEQLLTKHFQDWLTLDQQFWSGQYKETLASFRRLPSELQKYKSFQLVAIQAAAKSRDHKEYIAEMERFRRDHPFDPAGDLLSIDYYLLKKQYDDALNAIDRLDKALDGDPYLDLQRAIAYLETGRVAKARVVVENVIMGVPKLLVAYRIRVRIATMEKNHADTLRWLKKLIEDTGSTGELTEVTNGGIFIEFVKTPQFEELKQWVAERNNRRSAG